MVPCYVLILESLSWRWPLNTAGPCVPDILSHSNVGWCMVCSTTPVAWLTPPPECQLISYLSSRYHLLPHSSWWYYQIPSSSPNNSCSWNSHSEQHYYHSYWPLLPIIFPSKWISTMFLTSHSTWQYWKSKRPISKEPKVWKARKQHPASQGTKSLLSLRFEEWLIVD
jgi:hypothetical protein